MMTKLQKIVIMAAAAICVSLISTALITRPTKSTVNAADPMYCYDAGAVTGTPDIAGKSPYYGSFEIPVTAGSCKVSLNAAPKLNDDGKLDVYFANSAESTVPVKLVIFNSEGKVIGQSGLIQNGEYVKSVALQGTAAAGQQLNTKILTYEADTYYSLGSARATLKVS